MAAEYDVIENTQEKSIHLCVSTAYFQFKSEILGYD